MGNWITGLAGWEDEIKEVRTYWKGDPAVDPEKSDFDEYFKDLGKEHLTLIPGLDPVEMVIRLPRNGLEMLNAKKSARKHLNDEDDAQHAATLVSLEAFSAFVSFPEIEAANGYKRVEIGGVSMIPLKFCQALAATDTGLEMILRIGAYVVNGSALDHHEKKVLSRSSTKKTSGPERVAESVPIDASILPATEEKSTVAHSENESTDAQNLGQRQDLNRKAV